MSVNLRIALGTVNYLNYVHVTATKVSASTGAPSWETWIKVPVTNYTFVIPNLDPDNYYIRYYDAADASSLGMLRMEMIVNALTGEYVNERRFYTVGGYGVNDPADGSLTITDSYLIGKIVSGVFKEAFRYLKESVEYSFDPVNGIISKLDSIAFAAPEIIVLDIKYNVASNNNVSSNAGIGLYAGILTVTAGTQTLLPADRNKLIRCLGILSTQFITLPTLGSINVDDGFYFDNTVGGSAMQVKILTQGADKINYNGFNSSNNLFAEFWISKGEHLLIRKMNNTTFEIRSDYKGVDVGTRISGRLVTQTGYLPEDGRLLDGDEYGRLWYYITQILPSTHTITDDTVINNTYRQPLAKTGLFAIHSTLKKFRMPLTQAMTERALTNFNVYGTDTGRLYDYTGGFQDDMIPSHDHFMFTAEPANGNPPYMCYKMNFNNVSSYTMMSDNSKLPTIGKTSKGGGWEGRIKNIGVIYLTKI